MCALHFFNTRVSQFELNYWNKWTFPWHSNLLRCTCILKAFTHKLKHSLNGLKLCLRKKQKSNIGRKQFLHFSILLCSENNNFYNKKNTVKEKGIFALRPSCRGFFPRSNVSTPQPSKPWLKRDWLREESYRLRIVCSKVLSPSALRLSLLSPQSLFPLSLHWPLCPN